MPASRDASKLRCLNDSQTLILAPESLVLVCDCADFVDANFLLVACEVVIGCEKEHTVAFLAFAHGDTGTVPVGGGGFSLFVFIVAAGAEGRTKLVLVLCKSFDDDCRNAWIDAKIGASALGIAFREATHEFQVFFRSLSWFFHE